MHKQHNTMKKPLAIIGILAVVCIGGYFIYDQLSGGTDTQQTSVPSDKSDGNSSGESINTNSNANVGADSAAISGSGHNIIFLHHSTGANVWAGGVSEWFDDYNAEHGTSYRITDREFPKDSPYGWENYPYDYWNIWVSHAGESEYLEEPTLEILTGEYDTIVWKHCFPVSDIGPDTGSPSASSPDKTVGNYKLQYAALKDKMLEFPENTFIVWTGAAQVQEATSADSAERAREFFTWVADTWDEPGDNIFIWDFYSLETEGSLYVQGGYSAGPGDSHPSSGFSQTVAPLFGRRITSVIEGNGDSSSITGA
ncbi:MAG: hypothetical protein WC505_01415 [Patescibacteria group bacterium]